MQQKNENDLETENQVKYEYKRDLDSVDQIKKTKSNKSDEMEEITGMVKLITLVFYGT